MDDSAFRRRRNETGWMTATDFLAQLANDPDYIAGQQRRERESRERERQLRKAEEPLLRDLRRLGVHVETAWDLIEATEDYRPAIADMLLEHLFGDYPTPVREGIAAALATTGREEHWPRLKRAYIAERDSRVKEGLASALAAAAGPNKKDELVALALDARNGPSRALVLGAIAAHPRGRDALRILSRDPEVGDEAAYVLAGTRRRSAVGDAGKASTAFLEVTSVSLDMPDLRFFIQKLGVALGLDASCVRTVIEVAFSIEHEATEAVDCPLDGGTIRFQLVGDDRDAADLYILSNAELAGRIRPAAEDVAERLRSS